MFSRFLALSKSLRPSGILDILRMCFGENERRKDLIASGYNDASEIAVRSSSSSNFSSLGKRSIFRSSLGFTMVEIMIVIAILGILAAAVMPLSGYYMMRARDLARVVDTHNLEKVLMMYEMDYGIFPAHELGCYPHNSIKSYIRKIYISPRGNGYDEGCGSSGMYGYGVSTDGHTALLMAMMERSRGGNYTGSTLGMTGSLTPLGDSNAMNTRKGDGNIYIVKIGGGSGTNTPVPPVPVVTDGDCSTVSGLCLAGSPSGYSAPVCGGSRTWTCNGQNGGIDKSCSIANTVCPANVTATFDKNGGGTFENGVGTYTPTTKIIPYNTAIGALPSDPSLVGYEFHGWYTDLTGGTQITVNSVITSNTTYYARWICDEAGYLHPACTTIGQTFTANSTYPGCDTSDKVVCVCIGKAQTWPMCNAGSTVASMLTGSVFQWGRNVPFSSIGTVPTIAGPLILTTANATTNFITHGGVATSNSSPDWLSPRDNNLWGGADTNPSGGSFLSLGQPIAMRGPCASGYHVPTAYEWCHRHTTINYVTTCHMSEMPTILQLPSVGGRRSSDGIANSVIGYQTSSSVTSGSFYSWATNGDSVFLTYRAHALPVRCIKDSE